MPGSILTTISSVNISVPPEVLPVTGGVIIYPAYGKTQPVVEDSARKIALTKFPMVVGDVPVNPPSTFGLTK